MMWFAEEHPILTVLAIVLALAIIIIGAIWGIQSARNGVFNGNYQIIDNNWRYEWAIVQLGNGELIEGEVTSWRDFDKSDMIQITIDDNLTLLTHSSNVILCSHEP